MAYYPLASAAKKAEASSKFLGSDLTAVFRFARLLVIVLLAMIIIFSPELGSQHRDIGWFLLAVWGPLTLALDLWVSPENRVPVQTLTDLIALVVCSALLPEVWFPALVLGALIVGGSVHRLVLDHKLLFVLVPSAFICGMAAVSSHHQLSDTYYSLLAMLIGVPMYLLYALKEQRREQELRDRINIMDGLTRMAGGIGTDFNNILTAIQGNAELAEQKLDRNHVARPFLRDLLAESQKAQLFSAQLLAFSGGVVTGRARLDLLAELQVIASLLDSALPRGMHLKIEAQQLLPLISGNRAQLQEIMVASILRVAESVAPRPGGVSVTLRKVERRYGDELVVQARSSGSAEVVLGRAQKRQRSTGTRRFSLASARLVVREHGGEMDVHGSWRDGLVVTLRLPGLPATQANGLRPAVPGPLQPRHVLLLETAPQVRAVALKLLQELGHRVTCALTEHDVVEWLTHDDNVDVVMLDIPISECRALLDRIDGIKAGLPILLPGSERSDADRTQVSFVAKPYSSASLNSAIGRAIARATLGSVGKKSAG